MRRFADLYAALDRTTRTSTKVDALEAYFREAPAEDAAWALYFLSGGRLKRLVSTARLREWTAEISGYPLWLVEESYQAVGDLAETLALLLEEPGGVGVDRPLHRLVETRLQPLAGADPDVQRQLLLATWQELDAHQRLVWNKLITGAFRVGVGRVLVERALARVAGIDPARMAHRLSGGWQPDAGSYRRLLRADVDPDDPGRPYPFFLAHALEGDPADLGAIDDWLVEWKWDGIRAQLIRRRGQVLVWSRGEELLTDRFPEVRDAARGLPDGTVLDGELVGWANGRPLPFGDLQRRIGRVRVGRKILADVPVRLVAYDLMEEAGRDRRSEPIEARRRRLVRLLDRCADERLRLSPLVEAGSWDRLRQLWQGSRERGVEGMMLKRRGSPYRVGRPKGDWWKWKVEPYTVDAVLIYAQRGHGRRASLYTDYTFGVWDGDALVPVAKAYSGLTDDEIREVDRFVRRNMLERFGPVRSVRPELVFELAFEGIRRSPRHRSGVALRFPRMRRWRRDKRAADADTLATLRALLTDASG
jgi:DNA ligase-1